MDNTISENIQILPSSSTKADAGEVGSNKGTGMGSARNITIERKVWRLLEVDINDTFRGVLNYTEDICPFLVNCHQELNKKTHKSSNGVASDVNNEVMESASLNKRVDERKKESNINGMSNLFQDMDELLYYEMGFGEEEAEIMSDEGENEAHHDYNNTERNNNTPLGITDEQHSKEGTRMNTALSSRGVVGCPPPLLGLLRHGYHTDPVHVTNEEHSPHTPSTTPTTKPLSKAVTQPLEHQCTALHDDFLRKIGLIADAYREVADEIKELQRIGNDIHATVSEAAQAAEPLMMAVATYTEELKELKMREEHIRTVMEEYHVSAEERRILQYGEIDETFISVLEKVKGIHSSCRGLLVAHLQQAVIEVMEDMYLLQMAATDRLAQYICGILSSEVMVEDCPELNSFLIRCVMLCADRLPQLERIFHEVSTVRRTVILRQFNDLLKKGNNATLMSLSSMTSTSDGSGSVTHRQKMGPVPLQSLHNDPVRFFTAFLTWLHQTIAAEDDILQEHLFFCLESNNSNKHHANASHNNNDGLDTSDNQENHTEKRKHRHHNRHTRNTPTKTDQSSLLSREESTRKSDVLKRIFDPLGGHFRTHYTDISVAWTEKAEVAMKQLDNDIKRQASQGIPRGSGSGTLQSYASTTLGRAFLRSFSSTQEETPNNNNTNPGAAAITAMIICFKLDGLFAFYAETIAKLLCSTTVHPASSSHHTEHTRATALVSAITDAKWDSTRIFFNLLHTFVSTVMSATAIDMYIRPALTIIGYEMEGMGFIPRSLGAAHDTHMTNEDTLTFLSFYQSGDGNNNSSSSPVKPTSSASSPLRTGFIPQSDTPMHTNRRPYNIADSMGKFLDCPEHIIHLIKLSKTALESVDKGPVPFHQKESEVEPVLGGILDPLAGIVDTSDISGDTVDDNNNTRDSDPPQNDESYKTKTGSSPPVTDSSLCKLVLRLNIYNRFISDSLMEFPFPSRLLAKINAQVSHDVKWYAVSVLHSRIYPWLGMHGVMTLLMDSTGIGSVSNNTHNSEAKEGGDKYIIDMVRKAERRFTHLTYAIKGLQSPPSANNNNTTALVTSDSVTPTHNTTSVLSDTYNTEQAFQGSSIIPFLDGLRSSPRIREAILLAVAVRLSKLYSKYYSAVVASAALGQGNTMKLTPEQVHVILLSDD